MQNNTPLRARNSMNYKENTAMPMPKQCRYEITSALLKSFDGHEEHKIAFLRYTIKQLQLENESLRSKLDNAERKLRDHA